MPTIKELINSVQTELGFAPSANLVGNSDKIAQQLLQIAKSTALQIKASAAWPELTQVVSYTMFSTSLTGSVSAGSTTITGLSSTTNLQPGFTINASAFLSDTTSQGDSVRIVSVDSATQVTASRAASVGVSSGSFVFAQDRYSLPANFDKQQYDTFWQQSQRWKMTGPLTPAEWELRKNGIVAGYPTKRFRVFGQQDEKLTIDASPVTSDNGAIFVFEYLTRNIFRPKTWAASTTFGPGTYCSLNGNIYYTTGGGTTGSTAPRHLSGSVSDGGVTWAFFADPYETIQADTDSCVFERDVMEPGIKFAFCKAKRLKYDDYEYDYRRALSSSITKLQGASILSMSGQSFTRFIDEASIPDTGYGAGYQ